MIKEYLLGKITLDELYESFNELITKKIIKGLKGEDMWIYWKEQCEYCKNKEGCEYKNRVQDLIERFSKVESSSPGVYGSLSWKCDYFIVDKEEYYKKNEGECAINDSN